MDAPTFSRTELSRKHRQIIWSCQEATRAPPSVVAEKRKKRLLSNTAGYLRGDLEVATLGGLQGALQRYTPTLELTVMCSRRGHYYILPDEQHPYMASYCR